MKFSYSPVSYQPISLSKRDRAFISSDARLNPFIPFRDSLSDLRKKIIDRQQFHFFRKELHQEFQNQYAALPHLKICSENISSIQHKNTFTVTTAHQPSLFTGPLYFIYKAASCIHLADQLQQEFPKDHFVPVFILGAEDHDFDEINHLHLYNKTIFWSKKAGAPTGMMSTDGLQELIKQVAQMLPQTPYSVKITKAMAQAFTPEKSYADATQEFIHHLFGKYGMLTLQMNSAKLKRLAIPIFRKEILERPSFVLINQTLSQLKDIGFKPQAKPRELNLFYMTSDLRKRIVFEGGLYRVMDTDIQWSETEILQKLEESPQSFSPNVILRPLYQELILPNIAYVGGGGELAYWQERYRQFQAFGISYPVLIRRNSVLWINPYMQKQMAKTNLSIHDLFLDPKALLLEQDDNIDLTVEKELNNLESIYQALIQKAEQIDPSLRPSILAEKAKQEKSIRQIESKLLKAYKLKNQNKIQKIRKIQTKLFPNNGLQERYDNFLSIYAEFGHEFIDFLVQHLNPLDKSFGVLLGG